MEKTNTTTKLTCDTCDSSQDVQLVGKTALCRACRKEVEQVKHTPGPWDLDSAKDGDSRYFVIHGQIPAGINADFGYPIADTMNRHHCVAPDEDAANARLIAAAPELLAALNRAQAFIDDVVEGRDWEGCAGREILIDADEAIAKATGGAL